jgi:hypothetical protein
LLRMTSKGLWSITLASLWTPYLKTTYNIIQ